VFFALGGLGVLGASVALTAAGSAAGAATTCPARGARVVFSRSKDAYGGNWGIAKVQADGSGGGWVFGPEKGGAYNFRPSVSPTDGTIVWDTNQGSRQRIRTMACDGSKARDWTPSGSAGSKAAGSRDAMAPAFSPDGTKVAFVARMPGNTSKTNPKFGLYVAPFDHPAKAHLVTKQVAAGGMHPAWSPDGTKLAFGAGSDVPHIAVVNLDGTGFTQLTRSTRGDGEPAWSPDGKQIAYNSTAEGDDVWIMDADGANARKLATADMGAYQPAFSPDGQWVAYVNNAVGHSELWLIHPDGTGAHALTTTSGKEANEAPAW
jgi:Tol biopolymer transport system component